MARSARIAGIEATPQGNEKMNMPAQRIIESNGIRINIAEQGEGPLVLLVHGFPESWFSWRHQIAALSAAGFRVVAPDMRGYGKSDAPQAIEQYTILLSSATWSAFSIPWAWRPPSSSGMTGAPALPGRLR